GDLARAPGVDSAKKIASFVFDKERLRAPDPHLPDSVKPAHGEKLKGVYQICVGTDGKVNKVTTLQSISGADQTVMEQIRETWADRAEGVRGWTAGRFSWQVERAGLAGRFSGQF